MSLRVSGSLLVVPPFECAWLTGPEYTFREGKGCLCFEAKGETDVTVILKSTPGAKRLQPLQRRLLDLDPATAPLASVEPNYTIILGSHRNSCLKIEKNGDTVAKASHVKGARVDSKQFTRFWVQYEQGVISVGVDAPSPDNVTFMWQDDAKEGPITGIRHVGLSCWNRHVSFRSISGHPLVTGLPQVVTFLGLQDCSLVSPRASSASNCGLLPSPGAATTSGEPKACSVDCLFQQCMNVLTASVSPYTVCEHLSVAYMLLPQTAALYRLDLDYLASHFLEVLCCNKDSLCLLASPVLADLLHHNSIPAPEKAIFDAIEDWAAAVSGGHEQDAPCADTVSVDRGDDADGASSVICAFPVKAAEGGCGAAASKGCDSKIPRRALEQDVQLCLDVQPASGRDQHEPETAELVAGPVEHTGEPMPVTDVMDSDVALLLSLIRYPLMRPDELEMVLKRPLIEKHAVAKAYVEEALSMCRSAEVCSSSGSGGSGGHTSLAQTVSMFTLERKCLVKSPLDAQRLERFQRRCLPASQELSYVCDGDNNGVLHYIGTLYGTQEWVNPVLAKRVVVKASSPVSRQTDPKAIVGDKFPRTNFAGPRYIDGAPVTWWSVDLGEGHSLLVNYYTIRQDGSTDFVRHWVLQASNDGQQWSDVVRHRKDATIKRPSQYASFPVLGPSASAPYRFFRLLLEGPTTSVTNPNNFCLSYFELYGHFYLPTATAQPEQQLLQDLPRVAAQPEQE